MPLGSCSACQSLSNWLCPTTACAADMQGQEPLLLNSSGYQQEWSVLPGSSTGQHHLCSSCCTRYPAAVFKLRLLAWMQAVTGSAFG